MADGDNQCVALFDGGQDITATAEAAVTGKRFVQISDPYVENPLALATTALGGRPVVSHATAGGAVLGVASGDAGVGSELNVLRGGKVVPVKSGANITAGVEVEVGTSGQAITKASGIAVGIALNTVTSGADVPVALYN